MGFQIPACSQRDTIQACSEMWALSRARAHTARLLSTKAAEHLPLLCRNATQNDWLTLPSYHRHELTQQGSMDWSILAGAPSGSVLPTFLTTTCSGRWQGCVSLPKLLVHLLTNPWQCRLLQKRPDLLKHKPKTFRLQNNQKNIVA